MDVRIVEERSYTAAIEMGSGSGESHSAHTQRKHFLYFTDDRIFSMLMEICRTLGIYAGSSMHIYQNFTTVSSVQYSLIGFDMDVRYLST